LSVHAWIRRGRCRLLAVLPPARINQACALFLRLLKAILARSGPAHHGSHLRLPGLQGDWRAALTAVRRVTGSEAGPATSPARRCRRCDSDGGVRPHPVAGGDPHLQQR
jgi:hypothetical protein